jgi:EmrB/QacA subfamily drug resistance transporter
LTAPGRTFRSYLPVLVSICTAAFMVQLDISIVNIALPTLAEEMSASTSSVSRIVLFYLLAVVSTLLLFGRISDRIGRKRIFITGYAVFALSSVLCGLAGSLGVLEATRALQGVGGAMLAATLSALIMENVDERFRGRAFSTISVFSGIGFAAGAPLGALIVNHIGWRWIFFLNLVPGAAGILLASARLKPDARARVRGEKLDLPGVVLSSASVFALVIALNRGTEHGWLSARILGLAALSAILLAIFLRRLRRVDDPLIWPDVLRNLKTRAGLVSRFATIAILNGSMFLYPFFMSKVMGLSVGTTGLLMGIFPSIVLFVSPFSGWMTDRIGPEKVASVAGFLLVCATGMFLGVGYTASLHLMMASFLVFGIAAGLCFPAIVKLVMEQAPEGREGVLGSVNSLASFLGSVLGIAAMETIFSLGFPRVHDFTSLEPAAVSGGFSHAMYLTVALAVLVFYMVVRTIRPSRGVV